MKRKAREIPDAFARGFVATALLATVQDRCERGAKPLPGQKILRHAIQGGTALAAGTVAAQALLRRDFRLALTATAIGAAGLLATEYLLNLHHQDDNQENGLGQEEA